MNYTFVCEYKVCETENKREREQIEENTAKLGDSVETLVLLLVLSRSVHLKVGLWSLASLRIRFYHSGFVSFVLCCSVH